MKFFFYPPEFDIASMIFWEIVGQKYKKGDAYLFALPSFDLMFF